MAIKFITPWIYAERGKSERCVWEVEPKMHINGTLVRHRSSVSLPFERGREIEIRGEYETDNARVAEVILKFATVKLLNPAEAVAKGVNPDLLISQGYDVKPPAVPVELPPLPEEPEHPDFTLMHIEDIMAWCESEGLKVNAHLRKDKLVDNIIKRLKARKEKGSK